MTAVVAAPVEVPPAPPAREGRLPWQLTAGVAVLTATPVVLDKLQALDVVFLAALPFLAGRLGRDRLVRVLAVTLVVWAVGQQVSDYLNGPGPRLSMQFVAAVTILGIVPVLLYLGRGDFRRMRLLVIGVAVGLAAQLVLVAHVPLTASESWKFGLNTPVSLIALALTDLAWQRGRRLPSVIALVGIAGLGVATDHRHLAGIAAITLIVLFVRSSRDRYPRALSVVAGLLILLSVLSGAFLQAAGSGVLGERSDGQVQQFGSNPVTILVNVRPEPFQELYLWSLRPVTGWGSLPALDSAAYDGSKQFLQEIGVNRADLDDLWLHLEVPGVPAHSQAMDSWARAGLAAIPFWLFFLGFALWTGISAIRFRTSPLVVLWTVLVLWDGIFSPLTSASHVELATYLALAIASRRLLPGAPRG